MIRTMNKYFNTESNTDIFIKIYRSFLSSGGALEIDQIIKPFIQMDPILHKNAQSKFVDIGAFLYSFLRLPNEIYKSKTIVVGQTYEILKKAGYDVENFRLVTAPARRRKIYFDEKETFCVFVNSVTDVDDLISLLTSFQIEWNKINKILNKISDTELEEIIRNNDLEKLDLLLTNEVGNSEFSSKFTKVWKNKFFEWIKIIKAQSISLKVNQIKGSYIDYQKSTSVWFDHIQKTVSHIDITDREIYFVSSNAHSIVNTITGFVNTKEAEIINYLKEKNEVDLLEYWDDINQGNFPGSKENFLWYVLKKVEQQNPSIAQERKKYESELGITNIESVHFLDINSQIIEVNKLSKSSLGEKLGIDLSAISKSNALILNIDYPLGSGAYMVLSTIFRKTASVKGVYILGKASFLNGKLGDIGIPTQVYDDHSRNTYIFKNCFNKSYFEDFKTGSVLENQYAVSTRGTYLHPEDSLMNQFRQGYTLLEMENGPYLSAIHETTYYERYRLGKVVNLVNLPYDFGIIHYASDTPFTKAITLGTRNLGYEGVEPTYASSLAILKRIIENEMK